MKSGLQRSKREIAIYLKTNIQYPTRNVQCPSMASLGSADYKIIKMAGYLTWKLEIGYWTLDIDLL
jgi:hypothetical protein